ncbi:hypothetical protein PDQ79_30955 [Bacillus cereus]|nr:hypothetical protein [Bacillus cereus]
MGIELKGCAILSDGTSVKFEVCSIVRREVGGSTARSFSKNTSKDYLEKIAILSVYRIYGSVAKFSNRS